MKYCTTRCLGYAAIAVWVPPLATEVLCRWAPAAPVVLVSVSINLVAALFPAV